MKTRLLLSTLTVALITIPVSAAGTGPGILGGTDTPIAQSSAIIQGETVQPGGLTAEQASVLRSIESVYGCLGAPVTCRSGIQPSVQAKACWQGELTLPLVNRFGPSWVGRCHGFIQRKSFATERDAVEDWYVWAQPGQHHGTGLGDIEDCIVLIPSLADYVDDPRIQYIPDSTLASLTRKCVQAFSEPVAPDEPVFTPNVCSVIPWQSGAREESECDAMIPGAPEPPCCWRIRWSMADRRLITECSTAPDCRPGGQEPPAEDPVPDDPVDPPTEPPIDPEPPEEPPVDDGPSCTEALELLLEAAVQVEESCKP